MLVFDIWSREFDLYIAKIPNKDFKKTWMFPSQTNSLFCFEGSRKEVEKDAFYTLKTLHLKWPDIKYVQKELHNLSRDDCNIQSLQDNEAHTQRLL